MSDVSTETRRDVNLPGFPQFFRSTIAHLQPFLESRHARSTVKWANEVAKCITIDDLRATMERRVPKVMAEYFLGGASSEITLQDNIAAFQRVRFNPDNGVKLDRLDLSTEVLGHKISMPVIAAPIGSLRSLWPRGEAVAAGAVGKAGTICTLSTLTGTRLEEVRQASDGPCWFQLYLCGGREIALKGIQRAKEAGFSALVLTIDTPVAGARLRDKRNGSETLLSEDTSKFFEKLKFTPQMMSHFSWLTSFWADGGVMQFVNILMDGDKPMPYTDIGKQLASAAVTWSDISWIREAWGGPIVIKGVHNVRDANKAVECGADAIVISNHGGRQLDRVLPTLKILQDVVPEMKGKKIDILMDGGVRSGEDVVAAVAMGAKAVLIGRAYAFGLGAGGGAGVTRAFDIIRGGIEQTMRLLGRGSVSQLDASCLAEYPF